MPKKNKKQGTKYDRRNFFIEVNHKMPNGEDIGELDLSSSYFRHFVTKRKVRPFQLTTYDAHRPDRVSIAAYGVMDFWWVILKFNDIVDVYYEFEVGDIIQIPNIEDIKDFLKTIQKKKNQDKKDEDKEFKLKNSKAAQILDK